MSIQPNLADFQFLTDILRVTVGKRVAPLPPRRSWRARLPVTWCTDAKRGGVTGFWFARVAHSRVTFPGSVLDSAIVNHITVELFVLLDLDVVLNPLAR